MPQERARRRAMEVNGDRDVISRQIARARRTRPHARRSAAHAGARRRLRRFHRPLDRRGGRSHSAPGARPHLERKGVSLKDLLVMKFGGTSVGTAERMRVAARLSAEQRHKRPVVIVVSAMSGITDLLLETTKHAEAGDRAGLDANMRKLEERHTEACRGPAARRQAETGAGRHSRAGGGIRAHHPRHADAGRPSAALGGRSHRHRRTALRAADGRVSECRAEPKPKP